MICTFVWPKLANKYGERVTGDRSIDQIWLPLQNKIIEHDLSPEMGKKVIASFSFQVENNYTAEKRYVRPDSYASYNSQIY